MGLFRERNPWCALGSQKPRDPAEVSPAQVGPTRSVPPPCGCAGTLFASLGSELPQKAVTSVGGVRGAGRGTGRGEGGQPTSPHLRKLEDQEESTGLSGGQAPRSPRRRALRGPELAGWVGSGLPAHWLGHMAGVSMTRAESWGPFCGRSCLPGDPGSPSLALQAMPCDLHLTSKPSATWVKAGANQHLPLTSLTRCPSSGGWNK